MYKLPEISYQSQAKDAKRDTDRGRTTGHLQFLFDGTPLVEQFLAAAKHLVHGMPHRVQGASSRTCRLSVIPREGIRRASLRRERGCRVSARSSTRYLDTANVEQGYLGPAHADDVTPPSVDSPTLDGQRKVQVICPAQTLACAAQAHLRQSSGQGKVQATSLRAGLGWAAGADRWPSGGCFGLWGWAAAA